MTSRIVAVVALCFSLTLPALAVPPVRGDLNGDGQPDVLWHNKYSGEFAVWYLDHGVWRGGDRIYLAYPFTVFLTGIAGMADYDGDGHNDLLFSCGMNCAWIVLMNGISFRAYNYPFFTVPPEQYVESAGDFNGDGVAETLRHMHPTVPGFDRFPYNLWLEITRIAPPAPLDYNTATIFLPIIPPPWHVAGSADFNNDGHLDIFWRNAETGENVIWLMQRTVAARAVQFDTQPDLDWDIGAIADYDGDGSADLYWHNKVNGRNEIWFTKDMHFSSALDVDWVDPAWEPAGPR